MLSRRSVRVKVLQLLYMLNRDGDLKFPDLVKGYNDGIWKAYELYIFQLYLLLRVTQQAENDAQVRAAKLLPNDDDRNFKPILYTNNCTKSLANHVGFLNLVEKYKCAEDIDVDLVRRIYQGFADTPEYKAYIAAQDLTDADHNKILLELYKFASANDIYLEMCEDRYNNLSDDESLVNGAMKKSLKGMPVSGEFYSEHAPSDETVRLFGEELLKKTNLEDAALFAQINPMLQNWDADRVAILDMIMLKMALCELLHFPTIPTKVTLNEYVEISKNYSTDKSKDFINGILDRLMKQLQESGAIQKEGRGLNE
jgi:transcription antitermination protein NusB